MLTPGGSQNSASGCGPVHSLSRQCRKGSTMNPFTAVLNDLQLTNGAQGPAGVLHLLCSFGRDNYGSTVTTNPYTEVKRLLLASAGRSLQFQEVEALYLR